jgi:2-polyprenyl-3-methyl-5-hydroxy-6-metoxy-1,4-benzoquinol methylase
MFLYPGKYKTEEEIKEYYRKDYRGAPQVQSLYTGERKLNYHAYFLTPLFEEWRKLGIDKPVIGEIGSAFGMFLNWVRGQIKDADLSGCELTTAMRKVAKYEYGINLTEEFDFTKKYDLIVSYHVLEHQLDPDINLKKYAECLKPGGVMYLSAPVWFRDADNSASGSFNIEEYWHPNHINYWSDKHFDWIIAKSGLEPIVKNTEIYGNTYLLKKSDKVAVMPEFNPAENLDYADRAYKCWMAINKNETALAIDLLPNCTTAWIHHYEFNRAKFDKDKDALNKFIDQASKDCPTSGNLQILLGDIRTRYEEYDLALDHFGKALRLKPNNPTIIMGIANCYRMKAKKETDPVVAGQLTHKCIDALSFVRQNSMEFRDKAISWLFYDYSQLSID